MKQKANRPILGFLARYLAGLLDYFQCDYGGGYYPQRVKKARNQGKQFAQSVVGSVLIYLRQFVLMNHLTRSVPQQSKILLVFSLTFDMFGFGHFQGVVKMKPPFWKNEFRDRQLSFFSALEGMNEIIHIKSFVDESNIFLLGANY